MLACCTRPHLFMIFKTIFNVLINVRALFVCNIGERVCINDDSPLIYGDEVRCCRSMLLLLVDHR